MKFCVFQRFLCLLAASSGTCAASRLAAAERAQQFVSVRHNASLTGVIDEQHLPELGRQRSSGSKQLKPLQGNHLSLVVAKNAPICLLIMSIVGAAAFMILDQVLRHVPERTCFNRLHEWDEGMGRVPGFTQVMDYLKLESGGGLHKIKRIIPEDALDWSRVLGALSVICFASYNVFFIFDGDIRAMVNCAQYQLTQRTDGLSLQYENLLSADSATPIITDPRTLLFVVCAEVLGLTVVLVHLVCNLVVFRLHLRSPAYHFNCFTALWDVADALKLLCSYSMLKLLWLVHPTAVARDLTASYVQSVDNMNGKRFANLRVAWYMLPRILAKLALLFVLFVSFGVKVAIVSTWIHYPEDDHVGTVYFGIVSEAQINVWLAIGNFFMQALGAMQLDRVLLGRCFEFVFAGTDAVLQEDEHVMLEVYKARIAQVIYEEFWDTGRPVAFASLILTLNDFDIQKLLLLEAEAQKVRRMSTMDPTVDVDWTGWITPHPHHTG